MYYDSNAYTPPKRGTMVKLTGFFDAGKVQNLRVAKSRIVFRRL